MGLTRGGPGLETSQVQGATTQNAHRSPEDSLGKCAAGQAQGTLPKGDRRNTVRKYALAESRH